MFKVHEDDNYEPLLLEEARAVSKDFMYLRGRSYYYGFEYYFGMGDAIIENIIVAPYNAEKQINFVDDYRVSRNPVLSLLKYPEEEYDVIVVATSVYDISDIYYMPVRIYARINSLKYSFPSLAGIYKQLYKIL